MRLESFQEFTVVQEIIEGIYSSFSLESRLPQMCE